MCGENLVEHRMIKKGMTWADVDIEDEEGERAVNAFTLSRRGDLEHSWTQDP